MKLSKLIIKNFRSCLDVELTINQIHAIVGANNAGKSTILRALDFFFNPSSKKITDESFWNRETNEQIRVEATFSDLTDSEKSTLASSVLPDGSLCVARVATKTENDPGNDEDEGSAVAISAEAYKPLPTVDWLQDEQINGSNIEKWWPCRDSLKVRELHFGATLGDKKPTVAAWKEKAVTFRAGLTKDEDWVASWVPNPKGYAGVLKGALPLFILVPAVRDVIDEAKPGKTNAFGRLLNALLEGIAGDDRVKVQDLIKDLGARLNRTGGGNRIKEIADEEAKLQAALERVFTGCDLELEFETVNFDNLLGTPKIYVNDGFRGLIENKGHGLQRTIIFCILQRYAEILTSEGSEKKRSLILGVEEPELYMHPQAQRTIRGLFREIALGGDQVLFTTHSSWLVDVAYFDEIIRVEASMRSVSGGQALVTLIRQLPIQKLMDDLVARCPHLKGKVSEATIREWYSHFYNPTRNEGFFAKRVILVEGQTELYALPVYAECLGLSLDESGVSIIECGTKSSMDRFYRIFNELGIPCFLLFDYDTGNRDAEIVKKSQELLRLAGLSDSLPANTTVYDQLAHFKTKWEDEIALAVSDTPTLTAEARTTLGLSPDTGKPLVARFIAKRVVERGASAVPAVVKDILEKATRTEWRHTCLTNPRQEPKKEGI